VTQASRPGSRSDFDKNADRGRKTWQPAPPTTALSPSQPAFMHSIKGSRTRSANDDEDGHPGQPENDVAKHGGGLPLDC
jgi:hypothetical protein